MVIAIFNAIAALPTLVKAIESFVAFLSSQLEAAKKRKLAEELAAATEKAKKEKDTSDMDAIFNPGKKKP